MHDVLPFSASGKPQHRICTVYCPSLQVASHNTVYARCTAFSCKWQATTPYMHGVLPSSASGKPQHLMHTCTHESAVSCPATNAHADMKVLCPALHCDQYTCTHENAVYCLALRQCTCTHEIAVYCLALRPMQLNPLK